MRMKKKKHLNLRGVYQSQKIYFYVARNFIKKIRLGYDYIIKKSI